MSKLLFAGAVAFSVVVAGCSQDESRSDPPVPIASTKSRASAPARAVLADGVKVLREGPFERTFEGIRFSVPKGWKEVEPSAMQAGFIDARFLIPTPHGDVSLTCSSNAGGIDTNVQRWIGQFQTPPDEKPTIEHLDAGGRSATWVDLHGEFNPGPMTPPGSAGAPIDRMLGVAIPLPKRDFYLKLTGPTAAVADVRSPFREFVHSADVEQ